MDRAEHLMQSHPDSSLAILNGISEKNVHGEQALARYSLLKSIALDRNYIDTTNFNILQPAIDYYLKFGTADERLRTLYYQGRIYQNQGDDDNAMQSFMYACDLKNEMTDTLRFAHLLVAQATLYFKQYKINEFIQNQLLAAKLYGAIRYHDYELKCYTNALDGYVFKQDMSAADSLLSLCMKLVHKNGSGEDFLLSSYISYVMRFGTKKEIQTLLHEYENVKFSGDKGIHLAQGYIKIGKPDKAIAYLWGIDQTDFSLLDSLQYASVKTLAFENKGDYKQALKQYKNYSALLARHHYALLTHELLFVDQKHRMQMEKMQQIKQRDKIIGITCCGILSLFLVIGWLYHWANSNRSKRLIAERKNEILRLSELNLRREKENALLELDKKALQTRNLEQEKVRLENERYQQELEAINLRYEKERIENECDKLKGLLENQVDLSLAVHDVIKERLDMLNSLLAKEISNNESHAKAYNQWITSIRKNKKDFMDSTRMAFAASHPRFFEYLRDHEVTDYEINYLCLYAIGLNGKEVGAYIELKRHYNISSVIRKKLGIDEHETNLGIYIRKLLKDFES